MVTDSLVWAEALAPAPSRPVARNRLRIRLERFAMRGVMVVLLYWICDRRRSALAWYVLNFVPAPCFAPCIGGNSAINCVLKSMLLIKRDVWSSMLQGVSAIPFQRRAKLHHQRE